jgi:phosphoglycerate dehydrogenase-like enzyme
MQQAIGVAMAKHKTLFLTQRGLRHQQAALEAAPTELDVVIRRNAGKAEVISLISNMEFLISERTGAIDKDIIAAGKKLRLIQRLGSQAWDIDTKAATKAGIAVCCMPVRTCMFVAEHMILQMLGLGRRIRELFAVTDAAGEWGLPPRRCSEDYFAYNWSKREKVTPLLESTVGILGFGEIGTEMARRLRGFRCRVLYCKRNRLPAEVERELGLEHVSRDDLARRCDFVACLLPNLPENNQSVGADFFAHMRRGAFFVHCGAPGVVNEDALIDALRMGHLGGGAIDCFTYEPLRPDDPMLDLARDPASNLLLTPHVAAGTVAASREERTNDYANILALLRQGELRHRLV